MNKIELINYLAAKTQLQKKQAATLLDAFTQAVSETLQKSETITLLPALGKFGTKRRTARSVMNPKTQQMMAVAAKTRPYFKASKKLKETVNNAAKQ